MKSLSGDLKKARTSWCELDSSFHLETLNSVNLSADGLVEMGLFLEERHSSSLRSLKLDVAEKKVVILTYLLESSFNFL